MASCLALLPGIDVIFHAGTAGQAATNAMRAFAQFYSNWLCLIHAQASLIELLC
jgi:hypothetical protein